MICSWARLFLGCSRGPGRVAAKNSDNSPRRKEYAEGPWRIAEAACTLRRGSLVYIERSQSLVLALACRPRFREEAATFRYAIWCADRHICTVSYTTCGVKQKLRPKFCGCEEVIMQQGFVRDLLNRGHLHGITPIGQVTIRNQAIGAPCWITHRGKFLSQMNP